MPTNKDGGSSLFSQSLGPPVNLTVPLKAMLDVFFVWYNFCRVHQTLRMTPAMEAGWTDHIWTVREILTVS